MLRIHPAISSFPLGLLIVACIIEAWVFLSKSEKAAWAANFLLFASLISSILTFLSGYQASANTGELTEPVQEFLSNHHAWGRFALISIIVTACFKWMASIATQNKKIFQVIYLIMLCVTLLALIAVSHRGGGLVFDHGVGVASVANSNDHITTEGTKNTEGNK